ncbi:MAG: hypothetical protein NTW29_05845 [Bacteroidetes bacterium]|nr:hypothetical protein [Bacteroidota bacterium]
MEIIKPQAYYEKRIQTLLAQLQRLTQTRNQLAWLRFFSVIGAFGIAWLLRTYGWPVSLIGFIIFTGLFLYFLTRDINNNAAIENTQRLITINQQELSALQHQFHHFPDGHQFQSPLHPYTGDLDIFGKASLYQYINRTCAEQAQAMLAGWLSAPADIPTLLQRQEGVKEIASQSEWRQQLQSYGMDNPVRHTTAQKLSSWMAMPNTFRQQWYWQIARLLLPLISFGLLGAYLFDVITSSFFLFSITLMMIICFGISKRVLPIHSSLSKVAPEAFTLSNSIAWIEQLNCKRDYLKNIQRKFSHDQYTASAQIRGLGKILERFDYRLNFLVFIPLNTFLCWDLQQVFALEKWKEDNRSNMEAWFDGLADMEAVSSLGNCSFNHPEWVFPVYSTDEAVVESENLGHPLIPADKRVNSSYSTSGKGQLSLITGSNMAGKSTFLRSVGVNIVLAMCGAPVCARSFRVSPLKVMSSMRISDNLEESTSTFYAELKKLKEIIEAVNRKEKVFLLLDEILRGTNSADRHAGSAALIKQLIQHEASGILATHDLELAKLVSEYPAHIRNYHFDVQVAGEELYFDYKLKDGVCQSMNASILMKKIGIEL